MISINSNEILRYERGALGWGPAIAEGGSIIAIIHRLSNASEQAHFLVRIDCRGAVLEISDPLPLPRPVEAMVLTGGSEAMAVVLEPDTYRFELNGGLTQYMYSRPHWYALSWKAAPVTVKDLGMWQDTSVLYPNGISVSSRDGKSIWAMVTMTVTQATIDHSRPYNYTLALGTCTGAAPPALHDTGVACGHASHVSLSDDSLLALVQLRYEEIQLWRMSPGGNVEQLGALSPRNQRKGEVYGPCIQRLPDGFLFLWGYFNKKRKRETRDGGLWFQWCDNALSRFDGALRLSEDREIPASCWRAFDISDSALVVWKDGVSKRTRRVRYVRFARVKELPVVPSAFPIPMPRHVFRTDEGVLALYDEFSSEPYYWALRSSLLTD